MGKKKDKAATISELEASRVLWRNAAIAVPLS